MKRLLFLGFALLLVAGAAWTYGSASQATESAQAAIDLPASQLFDPLTSDADVIYLIANSSIIFGPDPNGRSEEITFVGPVTVPKWPMAGYERRVLADGRQQIDIELVRSDLIGESYLLGGEVILGEHPDLKSLGTITERPRTRVALAQSSPGTNGGTENPQTGEEGTEEVPADFVVERKVLLTTAKGVLYNETAVPVRGRIDSIPPVRFEGTPTGVNVFRGMELPVALLDESGNVNGWFYSKTHMAYAVKPAAVERHDIEATVKLRKGDQVEEVRVSGPIEIHHGATGIEGGQPMTEVEVMVMALRGHSELLGGDIMVSETFSDREFFSRGQMAWAGKADAQTELDLYLDVYTPSTKLATHEPLSLRGDVDGYAETGRIEQGQLSIGKVATAGRYSSSDARTLYDENEQAVADVVSVKFDLVASM
jgi:hypothetical protein